MSRRDNLHFSLRRTLEKDGWTITDDPLVLVLEQTLLKADLGAEKFFTAQKEGHKIAVEIKDFDSPSPHQRTRKNDGTASALPMGIGRTRTGASVVFSREPSDLH